MAEQPPPGPAPIEYGPGATPPTSSGMATAALVLGIISLVMPCLWYVSLPCAILAIVLGAVARNKAMAGLAGGKSMATAGIVCGVISIGLVVVVTAGCFALLGFAGKHAPEIQKALEDAARQQQMQQHPTPALPTGPSSMLEPLSVLVRCWLA